MDDADLPGGRIKEYRLAAGLSQRELAMKCDPPMDFTAIGRIERNTGFTNATLRRISKALECTLQDLFLPDDMINLRYLSEEERQYIAKKVNSLAKLQKERKAILGDSVA